MLYIFDFDGLLVDTERIHYRAFMDVFTEFGLEIISFWKFCRLAHKDINHLRDYLFDKYKNYDVNINFDFDKLYTRKKERYGELINDINTNINMMPGATKTLQWCKMNGGTIIVVTNSSKEDVYQITKRHIILNQCVDHWITRDMYHKSKPDPECYHLCMKLYGDQETAIGFEDSIKGIQAMTKCGSITATGICLLDYPFYDEIFMMTGGMIYETFTDWLSQNVEKK